MRSITLLLLVVVSGCSGPTFTNLGNGVAVPSESIDRYANEHGITRAEARLKLREKSDDDRVKEHAAKHGISLEDAKQQIEDATR